MTRGEWYHCFKRPFGGGAGAAASQACSLVTGPYNRAASALPLTSQLGGPPPPSSLITQPPSVSFICRGPPAPEPSLWPAYRPGSHAALPQLRLTAALSSACQAYANKALSNQHALECQLSLCFLPFPLFFLSLASVCLYFAYYLAYSLPLMCSFLSICLSAAFSFLTLPSCSWLSLCIILLLGIRRTWRPCPPSFFTKDLCNRLISAPCHVCDIKHVSCGCVCVFFCMHLFVSCTHRCLHLMSSLQTMLLVRACVRACVRGCPRVVPGALSQHHLLVCGSPVFHGA